MKDEKTEPFAEEESNVNSYGQAVYVMKQATQPTKNVLLVVDQIPVKETIF